MYEWMKKKKCRAAKWTGEAAEIDFIVLLWNCSSWKRNRIQATCNRSLHLLPSKMLSTSSPTFLLRGGQGRREGGGQQRLHLEKEQLLLLFIASAFLTIFFYPLRLLLFLLEKRRKKKKFRFLRFLLRRFGKSRDLIYPLESHHSALMITRMRQVPVEISA